MCWCVLFLVLGLAPPVPILDYSVLPPANTTPGYSFTITIEFDGLPPEKLPIRAGAIATPKDMANTLEYALEDHPWVMERDGLWVTLHSLGKARVTNVTVTGDGPKPAVRWVLVPRTKK